jgi:hypothetical protein
MLHGLTSCMIQDHRVNQPQMSIVPGLRSPDLEYSRMNDLSIHV